MQYRQHSRTSLYKITCDVDKVLDMNGVWEVIIGVVGHFEMDIALDGVLRFSISNSTT